MKKSIFILSTMFLSFVALAAEDEQSAIKLYKAHNNAVLLSVDGESQRLYVREDLIEESFEIEVVDMNDQILITESYESPLIKESFININHLGKGDYLIKFKTSKGTLYKEFRVRPKEQSNI